MKLVAIMCVEEYSELARKLLKELKVPAFSESEIMGYKFAEDKEDDNWFANKHTMDNSHLFFTMCADEKAEEIMEAVKKCKEEITHNHVHAFVLNIEKSIT